MKHLSLGILVLFLAVSTAFSQDNDSQSDDLLMAGAGAVYRTSVYQGDDSDVYPIPFIYYFNGPFAIKGKSVHYEVYDAEPFSFEFIALWSFLGYDASDSPSLAGMADRDMTIMGGVSGKYDDGWGFTTLQIVTDLLGEHDGQEVTLSYSKRFAERRWNLTPSIGIAYQTSHLTDYYYGVEPGEVAGGRPFYAADSAFNPFAAVGGMYHLTEQFTVMGSVRLDWLDDEIADSPIVDEDFQLTVRAGLLYRF